MFFCKGVRPRCCYNAVPPFKKTFIKFFGKGLGKPFFQKRFPQKEKAFWETFFKKVSTKTKINSYSFS